MQWSEVQVLQWLNWAIREFTLEGVNISNFTMRGRELCKMEKEKFLKLAPPFMGDILWEHLDILQKGMSNKFSRVLRKPTFCICENKDADQLRGNREADQRLCFRYIDSTIPLPSKSEISSL